ncbi:MAG: hypothetical protein Q8R55_02525, partial [Candidatus Taylorbacteria bacterium]|nr:hypothetical protein [Candidatus Taylorbacteria bacterium]
MNINKAKLDKLLDAGEVKNILQHKAIDIFGESAEIIEVGIKTFKTYLDLRSYALAALYEIKAEVSGSVVVKKVFASAHSTPKKERDYLVGKLISTYLLKNPANILKIPISHAFIKDYGLFLQEYIDGELMENKIRQKKVLSDQVYELLASSLVEFQKIKIKFNFKPEQRSNFSDMVKNIKILE